MFERKPSILIENKPSGEVLITSGYEPAEPIASIVALLEQSAMRYPDRVVVAEKNENGQYVELSYREAFEQASAVAEQLLALGGGQDTPLMVLSGASRGHFVVTSAALMAGVPYVPVSTSYSSVEAAFSKLQAVFEKTRPRFIWSDCYADQERALTTTGIADAAVIWLGLRDGKLSTPLATAVSQIGGQRVKVRAASLGHDTIARYMFTSGSTGSPKGVIHTHGMIAAMLAARAALGEDVPEAESPRFLDWMPWSHVGAGVLRLAFVVQAGGAVYIDDGKPIPGEFEKTLASIKVVRPTAYAGAPLGWNMLVEALEQDSVLAEIFFANVTSLAYGSAAMPASTYERLQELLVRYQGAKRPMSTSLMSTEVAVGLSRYWPCEDQTVVGLPMPGARFKLLPVGDRFEIRVKGLGVTPGYVNDPERTAEAFDEEGFFKMGDAVTFADPERPEAGLRFAGRIAEQFKLVTGTWVSAGTLRAQLVAACAPWVRDVVICGINEGFVAALIWPNLSACSQLVAGVEADVFTSDVVMAKICAGLAAHNAQNPASSQSIKRFSLLTAPPSLGDGEITEKGYVNQALVQRLRADDVALLFGEAHPRVMII